MKVLVLTTSFPLNRADLSGKPILLQAKGLVERGFSMEVLAPHHEGAKSIEMLDGVKVTRFRYAPAGLEKVCYGAGLPDNVKQTLVAKIMSPPFLLAFLFSAVLKAKKFDLIHANWSVIPGFIGVICKLLYKKPLIVTVRGGDLEQNFLFFTINKFVFGRADYVIGVNSEYVRKARSLGARKNKSLVIYSEVGINERLLKLPIQKTFSGNLLFVSRLVPCKNLKFVLEALEQVKHKKPPLRLTVVGDGTERESLEKFCKEKGLSGIVSFEGKKPHGDVFNYLKEADVFVLPQIAEGVGVSLLEAMAAGVPTISGKVKGIEDVIIEGKTGLLVSPKDRRQLEAAILSLVDDNSERFRIAQNARNLIKERYRDQRQIDRIVEIYNKLSKVQRS
ncbi:MAG TPA: glycosyltransferase [Candidatus Nanoarchaeia archaeon]